jgi:hypothetical protein
METNELIPLIFELYSIEDIESIKFNERGLEYFKNFYSKEERTRIYEALKWAKENSNYDFKGIMKDAPVSHKLKFSNKEVYKYLMNVKVFMENEDFALLTDNRETKEF